MIRRSWRPLSLSSQRTRREPPLSHCRTLRFRARVSISATISTRGCRPVRSPLEAPVLWDQSSRRRWRTQPRRWTATSGPWSKTSRRSEPRTKSHFVKDWRGSNRSCCEDELQSSETDEDHGTVVVVSGRGGFPLKVTARPSGQRADLAALLSVLPELERFEARETAGIERRSHSQSVLGGSCRGTNLVDGSVRSFPTTSRRLSGWQSAWR